MSQITTHCLDTSKGSPAEGLTITLQRPTDTGEWDDLVTGVTNADGRIGDFLEAGETLEPGTYRLVFQTGAYYGRQNIRTFYPFVEIVFETTDTEHYHVPLLLNPFGYSTYRGS